MPAYLNLDQKKLMKTILLIVISFVFSVPLTHTVNADGISKMKIDKIQKLIETARKNATVENLRSTWDEAISIPEDENSKEWSVTRDEKLCDLLYVLSTVHNKVDPRQMDQQASLNVPGMLGIEPGTNPNAIKDPQLRKEYEAAIAQNKIKLQQINYQKSLNNFSEQSVSYIKAYINRAYKLSERNDAQKLLWEFLGIIH